MDDTTRKIISMEIKKIEELTLNLRFHHISTIFNKQHKMAYIGSIYPKIQHRKLYSNIFKQEKQSHFLIQKFIIRVLKLKSSINSKTNIFESTKRFHAKTHA